MSQYYPPLSQDVMEAQPPGGQVFAPARILQEGGLDELIVLGATGTVPIAPTVVSYTVNPDNTYVGSTGYMGPELSQGHLIAPNEMDVLFLNQQGEDVSPSVITYAVGPVNNAGVFLPIGTTTRIPLEMRTGRFRPNFQIGDDWYTGNYQVAWTYQMNATDTPITYTVPFVVMTWGIVDNNASSGGSLGMQATIIVSN